MAETVNQYQQGTFTSPVVGETKDPAVVLANDNNIRTKHNSHDADSGIHFQSSVLASRPAAGAAGRKWLTSDGLRVYYDTGATWSEIAYLPLAAGGSVTGNITVSGQLAAGAASYIVWTGRTAMRSPADGVMVLTNAAETDFSRLQFGGTTSSFPALKRSATILECVLADDSGNAPFKASQFNITAAASRIVPGATSLSLRNNADNADNLIVTDAGAGTFRAGITATTGTFSGAVTALTFGGVTISATNISGAGTVACGAITSTGLIQTTLTSEQLRLRYDATQYLSVTVNSAGSTFITPAGTTPRTVFTGGAVIIGSAAPTAAAAGDLEVQGALTVTTTARAAHLQVTDGVSAPTLTAGVAKIYVDAADGDLKVIFGDGIVKTLATDT